MIVTVVLMNNFYRHGIRSSCLCQDFNARE